MAHLKGSTTATLVVRGERDTRVPLGGRSSCAEVSDTSA